MATKAARNLAETVARSSVRGKASSPRTESRDSLPLWPVAPELLTAQVVRDDELGAEFLARWQDQLRHRSGVVDLLRIEGIDPVGRSRYDQRHYLLRQGDHVLACTRVVWDRRDRRVRVLNLVSRYEGARDPLLEGVIASLVLEAGDDPVVVVLDIRADSPELQVRLEAMGFIPTVYYPGLIAGDRHRIDALQYTLLDSRPVADSLKCVERLDWPAARQVVARVVGLSRNAYRARASSPTPSSTQFLQDR